MNNKSPEQSSEDAFSIDIEETQYWENNELYDQLLQDDSIINDEPFRYVLPREVPEAIHPFLGHLDWSIENITHFLIYTT